MTTFVQKYLLPWLFTKPKPTSKLPNRLPKTQVLDQSRFLDNRFFLHAMSQPLTSATIALELSLQLHGGLSTQAKAHVQQALSQLKHLNGLFSSLDPMEAGLDSFNLQEALNELLHRHHQPTLGKVVTPIFNLPGNPEITGNIFFFQEALSCLINNAFEAYPVIQNPKYVMIAAHIQAKQVVLHLGDVGPGMTWLAQKLMFIPGFTLKGTGHGLGLNYVQKIITKHLQGELKVVSFPQLGTLFVISLPIKPSPYNRSRGRS